MARLANPEDKLNVLRAGREADHPIAPHLPDSHHLSPKKLAVVAVTLWLQIQGQLVQRGIRSIPDWGHGRFPLRSPRKPVQAEEFCWPVWSGTIGRACHLGPDRL